MEHHKDVSYQAFKKKRPRWTKKVRRDLEYYALLGGIALGKRFTFDQLQRFGRGIGRVAYLLLKKDRGIVEKQLAMVFPESSETERKAWASQCFLHFGQLLGELFGMDQITADADQRISIVGEEYVQEGLERGKGIIVLGAHLGNWEVLSASFAKSKIPIKAAVKPLYDERLNQFFTQMREKGGIQLIERGKPKAARAILECFKNNEVFFVLMDQDTDVSSMFVPFFGTPAQTPIAASHLALKTDAMVLSGIAVRRPHGKFEVKLSKVGHFGKKKFEQEDLFRVTQQFNQEMERVIRNDPEQWAWFHRRWKHKPEEKDLAFLKEMESRMSSSPTKDN